MHSHLVRKSEGLVYARYHLKKPLSIKLITMIIANTEDVDYHPEKEYSFAVKDLMNIMQKEYKQIYTDVQEAIDELLKSPLHIETEEGWLRSNWIAEARYIKKEGRIIFMIPKSLYPFIVQLRERFLQYNIENILQLNSSYSIRLFEMLKDIYSKETRYNPNKKEVTTQISIEWLRERLDIPSSYQYSSGIKRRILEKAKKDFQEKTDIAFTYREIKQSRKVVAIEFHIFQKEKGLGALREFVALLRKNYAGQKAKIAKREEGWLGIDNDGLLYAVDEELNITRYKAEEAKTIYQKIYDIAKNVPEYFIFLKSGECLYAGSRNGKASEMIKKINQYLSKK